MLVLQCDAGEILVYLDSFSFVKNLWPVPRLSNNLFFKLEVDNTTNNVLGGSVSLPLGLNPRWILSIAMGV